MIILHPLNPPESLYQHKVTLIAALISNHKPSKVWNEITGLVSDMLMLFACRWACRVRNVRSYVFCHATETYVSQRRLLVKNNTENTDNDIDGLVSPNRLEPSKCRQYSRPAWFLAHSLYDTKQWDVIIHHWCYTIDIWFSNITQKANACMIITSHRKSMYAITLYALISVKSCASHHWNIHNSIIIIIIIFQIVTI